MRFSFDEFYKHSWDIEHVRSQTPKNPDGAGRQDWIVCNLEYFPESTIIIACVIPTGRKHINIKKTLICLRMILQKLQIVIQK